MKTRKYVYIITILIILIVVHFGRQAEAHDLHLSNLQEQLGPIVAGPSWVHGIGAVVAVEGYNGSHVKWYLLYKDRDLHHSGVHAKPLTQVQAQKLLTTE